MANVDFYSDGTSIFVKSTRPGGMYTCLYLDQKVFNNASYTCKNEKADLIFSFFVWGV